MKKLTATALLTAALAWPALSMAAPTVNVPWRGMVRPEDTAVFYVLLGVAAMLLVLIYTVSAVTKTLASNKTLWKAKWDGKATTLLLLVVGTLLPGIAQAQETATATQPLVTMSDDLFWIMVALNLFLAAVLILMLYNLSNLIGTLRGQEDESMAPSWLKRFEHSLTDAVPVELEHEVMTEHEYDGIKELDNKLPPWWLYMFYGTIFFGLVYLYHFHIAEIPGLGNLVLLGQVESGSQLDQYNMAMDEAAKAKADYLAKAANLVDENSVVATTDMAELEKGREVYKNFCVACHGGGGEGGVGPNLTDEFWLHGGGVKNIFKTIKYGVPAKGMIAWESQLNPAQMQQVSSYILTLAGTNPPNGKAPQGDVWSESGATTPSDSTTASPDTAATAVK